jgi:hypothetical protein
MPAKFARAEKWEKAYELGSPARISAYVPFQPFTKSDPLILPDFLRGFRGGFWTVFSRSLRSREGVTLPPFYNLGV